MKTLHDAVRRAHSFSLRPLVALSLTVGLLAAVGARQAQSADAPRGLQPTIRQAAAHDVSLPLRDLATLPSPRGKGIVVPPERGPLGIRATRGMERFSRGPQRLPSLRRS